LAGGAAAGGAGRRTAGQRYGRVAFAAASGGVSPKGSLVEPVPVEPSPMVSVGAAPDPMGVVSGGPSCMARNAQRVVCGVRRVGAWRVGRT
jgi:hypothetical protein